MSKLIPIEMIESKIYLIRGQKMMLDFDLARLYGVSTFRLNEQVKRNLERFPHDFMFKLSDEEAKNLISQIAISRWGGRRTPPRAFTENGIAMLSSVLKSKKAIYVNIQIMRTFTKLRQFLASHKELAEKFKELELQVKDNREDIQAIFDVIRKILAPETTPRKRIGFLANE
ncbi:ORF6N domain-containing protein [Candidatus Margulisiibacteriota bacterium]